MNWKTSVFGSVTVISGVLLSMPEVLGDVIGSPAITKRVLAAAALISGIYTAFAAKDANVAGNGSLRDPYRKP